MNKEDENKKEEKKENMENNETGGGEELADKLGNCEKERDEYLNGWKRALADLSNFKKDEAARLENVLKYSHAAMMEDMLPTLDSFDLALTTTEKGSAAERGMHIIRAQIYDALKRYGLEKIAVKKGDGFDPALHEALLTEAGDGPPDKILDELEAGYTLHGKVIRPARVKISKSHGT